MAFTLSQVVPWGRSFDEYVAMFNLSPQDLQGRLLGCGDGPAAFNGELTRRGGRVISVDPLYHFDVEAICDRIQTCFDQVLEGVRQNAQEFVWDTLGSPEELGRVRLAAMDQFLADYTAGKAAGRYLTASLPQLPFADQSFDLALCSHLLFLYSPQFDLDFHLASLRELRRVAREVRIFPLLELGSCPSRYLAPVLATLKAEGYQLQRHPVAYEFQRGGNEMLRMT
ncbi:hypothetical protein XM38_011050 [Halomicronema hongdechloris C2206]|uniref:Methyltransferase type 11 domain-containing protein n=1 Tax=Halomicronema hongdechloris C2206 TaxID=1641165 RepID=A0A1Z3HIQ0_9CYAN|nr:methyltransferase domain-containing protein [Halomicronema hongdechloris]ASC70175.1 hypothetical protein XM38_011050 [Halomicronema hongdechloris C2206]